MGTKRRLEKRAETKRRRYEPRGATRSQQEPVGAERSQQEPEATERNRERLMSISYFSLELLLHDDAVCGRAHIVEQDEDVAEKVKGQVCAVGTNAQLHQTASVVKWIRCQFVRPSSKYTSSFIQCGFTGLYSYLVNI